jgi:glycosyltransferase involved in cell wall biosynthesis
MKDPRVLVVDTFSGLNDYGVAMALALARVVPLTFLTVSDTRIPRDIPCRLLDDIPQWGGTASRLAKATAFACYLMVLVRELWRHRRGAVHVQLFRMEGVDVWVYVLMRPILRKLVFSAHNVFPHERRWWHEPVYRLWYSLVDEIHVLGNYSAQRLRDMGVAAHKIHFVPHGDYALFKARHPAADPMEVRQQLAIAPDEVIVLFYGLIREYKGLQRLVDAFCLLPPDSNAYLVVAGGGDESQLDLAREKLLSAGRLNRATLKFGYLPDPELANLINASDLVAFPYLHIYQSGALMLAMTYAKPVIASDIDGFQDYLSGQKNGLLVDTANTELFASELDNLVRHPRLRAQMAAIASSRCVAEFGWDRIAEQFKVIYD